MAFSMSGTSGSFDGLFIFMMLLDTTRLANDLHIIIVQ